MISGRVIKSLEISLDRWKSCVEVSRIKIKHTKRASVSFEATVDVSNTIEFIAKEIKIRAMVLMKKPLSSSNHHHRLVPDLIRLVLERLDFAAFHKARFISSDWYSTGELCLAQNPTPWLILFSSNHLDNNDGVSCKLYDPQEKKTYIVRDIGFGFDKSGCLANSGSWFLMLSHRTDFYLLNLFTRQRIRLPSLEAIDGWQMKFERVGESDFLVTFGYKDSGISSSGHITKVRIGNAVLWVDETTKDYLVVWNLDCFFAYHRRGDSNKTWKVIQHQGCVDMVLKDNKLYVLSLSRKITVFDFSSAYDSPKACASFPSPDGDKQHFNNLAVTLSGEVLIIASSVKRPDMCYLYVYKMDLDSSKWIKTRSIGEEALFFDQGTTVEAKEGVAKNCIYFSNDQFHRYNGISLCYETSICVYNLQTDKIFKRFRHIMASSPKPFKDARWVFPTFAAGKWLL
ncbi:unnamed protein product [Cochlearia groenlandica]